MKLNLFASFLLAFALVAGVATAPTLAGEQDPLFVNLTTDEPHRANMGISFGRNQADRGHPLTIFLNDRGVLIGARANAEKFAAHQKMLAELMSKGAVVLICPMCMAHYGVKESDLLPGLKVGNPGLLDAALFKGSTKTLTW
jgi:sulfur relay (sulfurtransferase) complex TusBCD TusD component (DsrE family)